MKPFSRWMLGAVAALAIATASYAMPPSQPWAQGHSDLPADVSVRFGTLPNGMRYAIKRNVTPKGAVSLRFRIDAGSLMERDDEQGIAHLLEHMAFRGSAHVADGDTVKKLQSLGLTFGADTNAFTAATQTVYSFDMPKNDTASVDTALMLMREIAGELDIKQAAMDTERNVVLAEAHLRDVPIAHLQKSDYQFLYGDRPGSALIPIGKEDVVAHATAKLVRGFYEAWYRPERATLIIVGDIDPAQIEAKIKAGFSDWKAKAPPRKPAHYVPPAKYGDTVRLFNETGAPPYLVLSWVQPYDPSPDNKTNERRDVLRFIATSVLNQRLAELSHGTTPPFISASANHDHTANIADVTDLVVTYRDGQMAEGLKTVEREWRNLVQYGASQEEIDQVVAQLRTFFQGNAAAADTTPSSQVINALLRAVDEKTVFTSPATDLVLYEAVVNGLKASDINPALHYLFSGRGPMTFVSGDKPLEGGEVAVKSTLAQADALKLSVHEEAALPPWPYTSFGAPGTVVSKHTVDDLGVTYVTFANGVTLTVKPTQYHAGQILISARIGDGRFGLPRDHASPTWALNGILIQGGLGHYAIDDLERRMAGKLWGATLGIGDDSFVLTGQSRAADLDTEMQILTAYVADPAYRAQAFDQTRVASLAAITQAEASPTGVLQRNFSTLTHGEDARWRLQGTAEINAATLDQAKAVLAPSLANGPIDITIVGDTTVDQAIATVSNTFGALPKRPSYGDPVVGNERFPGPTADPIVLTDHGAPNQAIAVTAWPNQGFMRDMKLQRTMRVLTEILSQRLIDELRTKEGITYTPGASTVASTLSKDYGYAYALAQIPPDKIADFYAVVDKVAADLAANPVSQDELERARGPRIEDIQREQQGNEYWLGLLRGSAQDPRLLDIIRTTIPDQKSITVGDIQDAARTWLKPGTAWRLVVVPDGFKVPPLSH
ncbi:MAG TPA: insulinase family protein [Rhizomicrobium sp.]|jgi:zinc protease|nr:insulinase family protein [Rhizomicrobium sp.]